MDMTILELIPTPNLGGVKLERPIKKELVRKSFEINSSAKIIGFNYSLSHFTIKKYRSKVLNGIPMYKYDGRPTKLDTEGVNLILDKINDS